MKADTQETREPQENQETVQLVSSDGRIFTVPVDLAKMSGTIDNLIEDTGITGQIPLPNVAGDILELAIQHITWKKQNPTNEGLNELHDWEKQFCEALPTMETLFNLILAANYLDIKCLLDCTCRYTASLIKGKTPQEIQKTFNIKNDFTPEEEEQIRKENDWCEEK